MNWKEGDKTFDFESFPKAIKKWGCRIEDNFDSILDRVEAGPEALDWEHGELADLIGSEEDWRKINRELYNMLDQVIPDETAAKQHSTDAKDKSDTKAWRRRMGRYDNICIADQTTERHWVIQPHIYIAKATNTE